MLPVPPFQQLTTCSWEQNDTIVKVYVPLRGIQTDMLRPVFTSNSAEVGYPNAAPGCAVRAAQQSMLSPECARRRAPVHEGSCRQMWRGKDCEPMLASLTLLGPASRPPRRSD